ncbi:hypothetical protein PR048_008207 [Dryococelus australis]|uniref:Uncharacterized protein n=1 Tax=Dryococelus australis TaxID=614101 RepID=A0ABQ9HXC4_9NEOP|nr:hypothetical protein PR048_008207 [Dryococelus australis]
MPQRNQPSSLEKLSLEAVGCLVITIGQEIIQPVVEVSKSDPDCGAILLKQCLNRFNELLYGSVPWYLYDKMAAEVLTSISTLIKKTKVLHVGFEPITNFLNQMNVVVNLTEIVIHPNLRRIDFSLWPKIMRHVLYKNLYRMSGLEVLNLGSGSCGWNTSDIEKHIVCGVISMKNLTSLCLCFDCTDHILTVVSQNCSGLQSLDVTASRSVTDRSVNALLACQQLSELYINRTSVTIEGYAILLTGLRRLEDLGRCDELGLVLEHIKLFFRSSSLLGLRMFESRDVTSYRLHLLVEMCPYVTHVSLYHDEQVSDLTILASLKNLVELKLMACDFFMDRVNTLLEYKGHNITCLHLEHVEEIDTNALIYIGQYCPNVRKLVFINCEFLEHFSISAPQLTAPPFQKLEHIVCVVECAPSHLEFLLSNCGRIRCIQLGSSTGIGDTIMARVLVKNPMRHLEELKILHSEHLSMQTVKLLMKNCNNLRVLSELESWQGITAPELSLFRQYIRENNINLDIRPTLSY